MLEGANLTTMAQCWPKLHTVSIHEGRTDAALTAGARHCPGLMNLWVVDACQTITGRSVQMLAQHCPKLVHVDLRCAHQVTEEAFTELLRYCSEEAQTRIAAANPRRNVCVRREPEFISSFKLTRRLQQRG